MFQDLITLLAVGFTFFMFVNTYEKKELFVKEIIRIVTPQQLESELRYLAEHKLSYCLVKLTNGSQWVIRATWNKEVVAYSYLAFLLSGVIHTAKRRLTADDTFLPVDSVEYYHSENHAGCYNCDREDKKWQKEYSVARQNLYKGLYIMCFFCAISVIAMIVKHSLK